MARIIKGGLINSFESDNDSYREKPRSTSQDTSNDEETWGQYGARNLAKVPALAYEHLRSGLGIGNLLKATGESQRSRPIESLRRAILPSSREAHEEISSVLPEYYTEHKPEDFWAEFALTELPFLAAGGAFKSLPALAKGVGRSLGIGAGVVGGSALGSAAGEALGNQELGELIGGLGGGLLGGKAAGYIHNMPSRVLPGKILEKERGLFHEAQKSSLKDAEGKYLPKLQELETQKKSAALELPRRKESFESNKKQALQNVKSEIDNYSHTMKELDTKRSHAYKEAKKLEKGVKGDASLLKNTIKEAEKNILHGVDAKDAQSISHNLSSLEDIMHKGELSLESAKRFQKNFNDQIYNRDASNSFKNIMSGVVGDLNEFIEKTGSPEHTQYWKEAEGQTREFKKLQREHKPFLRSQEQMKRDILREKFSPVEERSLKLEEAGIKNAFKSMEKEFETLKTDIGSKKFDQLKENVNPSGLMQYLDSHFKKGNLSTLGLSSMFYYLLGLPKVYSGALGLGISKFAREINIVRDVMKNHPEIYKEYTSLLKDWNGKPSASFIKHLNKFGDKVEEYGDEGSNKEEPRTNNSRIIRGGMINA